MNHIRLNNPLLPLLTAAALVMEVIDPTAIWLALLVVLGGSWLIATLWIWELRSGLRLSRSIRFGWAQVGDRLEEHFELSNRGWAPATWVEIIDESNLPDHFTSRATGIGDHNQLAWRVHTTCTRRGLFTLGPTRLRSGDPLGIYSLEQLNPATTTMLIMPPVVPLPGIQVAPGGRSGDGRPQERAIERNVSASSVRDYIPGDSLHAIHWPTSARRETLFVRLFDGTPAGDWRIILDLNAAVQTGDGWDSTEEHAVILAASLMERGLRLRRAVGMGVNGQELCWTASRQDGAHRLEMLRALAVAHPGSQSLAGLLRRLGGDLPARTSLVLITADPDPEWLSELLPLTWRGIQPTVLLLDGETFPSPHNTDANTGNGSNPAQLSTPAPQAGEEEETGSKAHSFSQLLIQHGISHQVIPHSMLDRPDARPGQQGRWEWRVMPTGKAVAVHSADQQEWRRLT